MRSAAWPASWGSSSEVALSPVAARLAAALGVVLAALAVAVEATTFDVAFPTDPLGPKAFPLLAAGLLVLGGGALVREARREARAPGVGARESADPVPAPGASLTPGGGRTIALAAASFVVYALLLAPLGFVPATTLTFAALARLFGGTLGRGALVGLVFALLLYVLFVYALGLPLPLGMLEA